ncbi:hypothetical protein [Ectothiorhodospira variabilis]|uniref:hypothetical protein n=1 Tax=Ectothiorhodospira variabilis TaxID=505694 RepID=UPI001EFB63B1|nr:hypothetical protein [Ectothiorhodospira variabilis]MCG5497645.1 hypothetical protein [Ectothiorhodospira variabilis]
MVSDQEQPVGKATPLDARANLKRRRQQPIIPGPSPMAQTGPNAIELALQRQQVDWALETDSDAEA